MNLKHFTVASAAALLAVSGAAAQGLGDIIFIDRDTYDIDFVDVSNANTINNLINYSVQATANNTVIAGLSWAENGVGGDLLVSEGPSGGLRTSPNQILRFTDPFGSATQSVFSSDTDLSGVIQMEYDNGRDQLAVLLSTIGTNDNGIGVVAPNGDATRIYTQPTGPRPRFIAGTDIIVDAITGDYLAMSELGGGSQDPVSNVFASALWRFDGSGNETLVYDFSNAAGIGSHVPNQLPIRIREMDQLPNGDLVVSGFVPQQLGANGEQLGDLYLIDLDSNGDFAGISVIATGLSNPQRVTYDFTNGTLVFAEDSFHDGTAEVGAISRINLDGTGYQTLATGVLVNNILIVPSPGAAGLLGIAGFAALRRRR